MHHLLLRTHKVTFFFDCRRVVIKIGYCDLSGTNITDLSVSHAVMIYRAGERSLYKAKGGMANYIQIEQNFVIRISRG
jgi:hypothetical protein